jgi:hypothetical protein
VGTPVDIDTIKKGQTKRKHGIASGKRGPGISSPHIAAEEATTERNHL